MKKLDEHEKENDEFASNTYEIIKMIQGKHTNIISSVASLCAVIGALHKYSENNDLSYEIIKEMLETLDEALQDNIKSSCDESKTKH